MPEFRLFPISASSFSDEVDLVTLALTIFSGVICLIVFGLVVIFSFLYRRGSKSPRSVPTATNVGYEISWIILLTLIGLGFFTWAGVIYVRMHQPPPNSADIFVVAKQWMWKFQHANGTRELNELHVPAGTSIRLVMSSQDVIHSFFVPEFRLKQDVLPGRYTYAWFEASKTGVYSLFCAEYCGNEHSRMLGRIIVMSPEGFRSWQGSMAGLPGAQTTANMADRGRELFTRLGCVSCHGTGSAVQAPDLAGIYGKRVALSNGTQVTADEGYLRESILNPRAKIVMGYAPIMPSYQGQISDEDLLALISYIKSLKEGSR